MKIRVLDYLEWHAKSYNPYPEVIGLESKEILEYYKNKEMLALDL